jgi:hypothetical protein
MPRLRLQGHLYQSDEDDLHLIHEYDLWSDFEQCQDYDITIPPITTREIDLSVFEVGIISYITLFVDGRIDLNITGEDEGTFQVLDSLMLNKTSLTSISLTNPSTLDAVRVKLTLGGR